MRSDRLVRAALRVWTAIGAGLLLFAFWWLFRQPLGLIGPPLAIAALLVYVLDPGVSWLERHRVVRPLGTLMSYVIGFGVLWFGLSLLGPLLVDQARGLLDELPRIGQDLQVWVNRQLASFGVPPSSRVDFQPEALTQDLRDFLTTNQDQVLGLLRGAGSVVSWAVHIGLALVLGPILAFYALSDLPRLGAGMKRLLPPARRPEVVEVTSRIGRIVGAYFRGQLLVATFVGTATAVGLAVIGLPFWAVVGVTTGIFNLVPLVGPTAGAVFGVLLALTVGTGVRQALLVLVVMVVVQQIDNHLITPVIVSRSVSIHPITVIIALIVAGSLGGIPAMFIAIPAVAVFKLVLVHVVVTRVPSMAHVADEQDDGVDRRSRYGTVSTLAQDLRRSFERRLAEVATTQRWQTDPDPTDEARAVHSSTEQQDGSATSAPGDHEVSIAGPRPRDDGPEDGTSGGGARGGDVSPPAGVAPPT